MIFIEIDIFSILFVFFWIILGGLVGAIIGKRKIESGPAFSSEFFLDL